MHQSDYILRIIERLGPLLAAVRRRLFGRWRGEAAERGSVRDSLRQAAGEVGLELEVARAATPETLALLVAPTGELEPGRCWVLAETLYLDGLDRELEGRPDEALDSYERALRLYGMIEPGSFNVIGLPEAEGRIREIEGRIADGGRRWGSPDGGGADRAEGS